MRTWRDTAAPIIRAVLERTKGETPAQVRKALREAYPFGEREMWPYKVWCDEIRRQTGRKIVVFSGKKHTRNEKQMSLEAIAQ